jgi:hypothetical protein
MARGPDLRVRTTESSAQPETVVPNGYEFGTEVSPDHSGWDRDGAKPGKQTSYGGICGYVPRHSSLVQRPRQT